MKAIALAALLLALTAPTASAAEVPKLKRTLTYARTGGIAGVNDNFRIKRDGWSLLNGREFRLRKVEREAIAKLVEEAKLEQVKVDSEAGRAGRVHPHADLPQAHDRLRRSLDPQEGQEAPRPARPPDRQVRRD